MFQAVRDSLPSDDPAVMALLSVDSTSVRAHQHAAVARFNRPEILTGARRAGGRPAPESELTRQAFDLLSAGLDYPAGPAVTGRAHRLFRSGERCPHSWLREVPKPRTGVR